MREAQRQFFFYLILEVNCIFVIGPLDFILSYYLIRLLVFYLFPWSQGYIWNSIFGL